jgi:hypothetical protein
MYLPLHCRALGIMESPITAPTQPLNWRQCSSPEDLWSLASWSDDSGDIDLKDLFIAKYRAIQHRLEKKNPGFSFSDCLVMEIKSFLRDARDNVTQDKVTRDQASQEIDWQKFDMYLKSADHRFDALVEQVYLELKRLSFEDPYNIVGVIECLKTLFTISDKEWNEVENAFGQPPQGHQASQSVYEEIVGFYRDYEYGSWKYVAPYTSVVGPSGIGKSYSVQQLAREHNIYVVYSSLAPRSAGSYPRRTAIADHMLQHRFSDPLQFLFFECYLLFSLAMVDLCRMIGISPTDHFYLQTRHEHKDFDCWVGAFIEECYEHCRKTKNPRYDSGTDIGPILGFLKAHKSRIEREIGCHLGRIGHIKKPELKQQNTKTGEPTAIICVDEARGLLDSYSSFRSFQRALAECWNGFRPARPKGDWCNPGRDYFGLLLHTTSRVANFSPSPDKDPSLKVVSFGHGKKLLPLIYAINSMDIYVKSNPEHVTAAQSNGLEIDASCLFSYGRPLWGSHLKTRSLSMVMDLAEAKVCGNDKRAALALLSYRLDFYVGEFALAEELVSSYLRYIRYINADWTLLRTYQPSEPILASTAERLMLDSETRFRCVQELVANSFEGTINVGDVGQIAASLLLMFALDETHYKQCVAKLAPQKIRLRNFISSLLGTSVENDMAACVENQEEMRGLFADGVVFFNHFLRLTHDPTENTLQGAFARGAALFAPFDFPGGDLIIPVLNLSTKRYTFIIIQVSDDSVTPRLKAANDLAVAAQRLKFTSSDPLAHIAIIMCLRSDARPQNAVIVQPEKVQAASGPITRASRKRRASTSGESHYQWEKTPRILLLGAGLNEVLYPALGKCSGQRDVHTARVVELLKQLLDCIPEVSVPPGSHDRYQHHLMPIR